MKARLIVSLLFAAVLPACTTVKTTSNANGDDKRQSYAGLPGLPAETPETDIPAEGPRDIYANPAYIPTPLLRTSAAGGL